MDLDQPPSQSVQPPAVASQNTNQPPPAKPMGTILLVEDDLPMVKMYSTKLQSEGFAIETASDGEEGLAKIKEQKVDLVLLDLMIPKLGGMQLLEIVKNDQNLKKTPIVILSNLSQDQDIKRARELGVEHFLIKSNYTPSQVVEVVRSYFVTTKTK